MQMVRCSLKGVLPVAAISGSLPWRSASSHWYKATDEPHAERHGAKEKKQTRMGAMLKQMHKKSKLIDEQDKSMKETHTWSMLQQSMKFKT